MEQVGISGRQMRLLIIGSVTVMGHLLIVPLVFGAAGRDAWFSLLLALVPGFALAMVLAGLGRSVPGKSLVELSAVLLGKHVGKVIGLAYAGFFLIPAAITLRGLMDFMTTAFMTQTPPLVLGLIFLLVCGFAVMDGLESLARTNELLLPLLITSGILAASLSFPEKDYQKLLPILERGMGPVLHRSIPLLCLLGEMVVIAVLQPSLKRTGPFWKNNVLVVLIVGLLLVGPLTGPVATFGEKVVTTLAYPTYNEIEFIRPRNVQTIAVLLWLFGSFGRVSLFFYASALSTSQVIGLTDYRKLAVPLGIVILIISIVAFPNDHSVRGFLATSYAEISIVLGMILPAFLWAAAAVRGHQNDRKH